MKPHIFYDADGTLFDSLPAHIKFLQDMNIRFKGELSLPDPLDYEASKKIVDSSSMVEFVTKAGFPIELVNSIQKLYTTDFNKNERYSVDFFPGTPKMIRMLSSKKFKQGIISANYIQNILKVLIKERVQHLLHPIVDRIRLDEHYSGSKANYLKFYGDMLELSPKQIVYVGDTTGDLKNAEEAGVNFIAVGYGWEFSPGDDIGFPIAESPRHLEELLLNKNL